MKIDVADCKNLTAKKAKIRKEMTEILYEFLLEKFGDAEGDVLRIGTNEIAVAVGIDKIDGFDTDVCVVVKPEVKSWIDSKGEKREVKAFDRFEAAENYEIELKAKEEKKRKKD